MLMKEIVESLGPSTPIWASCRQRFAEIRMHGYTGADPIHLCHDCAPELARTLLKDLCDLRTLGGRYEWLARGAAPLKPKDGLNGALPLRSLIVSLD